jgi:polyhydroxybutyrate depolymerase
MKKTLLLLILFLNFNYFTKAQDTINATLQHDGMERSYIIYVPESYSPDKEIPLLLCFHGYTSSNKVIMNYSNFNAIADTANFIVVYPQGTLLEGKTHWNVGGWTLKSKTDDVGFVNLLLDSISDQYNIDPNKIYSTGMSNGGFMSFLLACQLSDRIAAVASIAGSMTIQTFANCNPAHPTPVLQMHGDADGTVPYQGAARWTKSIEDVVGFWVDFNQLNESPEISSIPSAVAEKESEVTQNIYAEEEGCATVTHYKITDGEHTWPGAWGNKDVNASVEVWRFLSQYSLQNLNACARSN